MGSRVGVVVGVAGMFVAAGCAKTLEGSVTQPNPLDQPPGVARQSEPVVIVTGDMELELPRAGGRGERYPLTNTVTFVVVSRDRLRFHVQIEHKWQEYVDLDTWEAELVDDRGQRHLPEEIDSRGEAHIVQMWDYETRTAVRDRYGDVAGVLDDGYRRRNPLGSLSVFRGRGDVVFHHRDLFGPDVRWIKLVLRRGGLSYVFTWRFTDEVAVDPDRVAAGT